MPLAQDWWLQAGTTSTDEGPVLQGQTGQIKNAMLGAVTLLNIQNSNTGYQRYVRLSSTGAGGGTQNGLEWHNTNPNTVSAAMYSQPGADYVNPSLMIDIGGVGTRVVDIYGTGVGILVGGPPASALSVNGGISAGTYYATAAPSGGIIISGNVGIGTTAPEALLEVQGAEGLDAVIALDADDGDDTADTWFLKSVAADNDLDFVNDVTVVATLTKEGNFSCTNILSGVYTPTRSAEANLDANVTPTEAQYLRVGNTVHVSGRVTGVDPTAAGAASFELSLPIASNLGAAEDCAGVAFCGTIAGQGAAITGSVANNTAVVSWIAVDVTSQSWSYTLTYQVI